LRSNRIIDLKKANFTALTDLPIKYLNLSDNAVLANNYFEIRLNDVALLGQLPLLEELYLVNNDIHDISAFEGLANCGF